MADAELLSGLSIDRQASGSTSRWPWFLLSVVMFAAGAGVSWFILGNGAEAQVPATKAPVQVATVTTSAPSLPVPAPVQGERAILDASGYVVAMRIATASSKTVGRVEEVLVEEGDTVTAGQIVARLDAVSQRIQLDLTRARLARAKAARLESEGRLREAESALERVRRLNEAAVASAEQVENAAIRVDILRAELMSQAADIDIAEQEILLQQQVIEDSLIRAPFDGVVIQKSAQPGEIISPSTSGGGFTRTGICTIVDMNSLEMEVDVAESRINRIAIGQRAEAVLDAYPDWTIPAEVSAIVPTADRQRATIKVRVRFLQPGDARILPDMGIKVSFFEN